MNSEDHLNILSLALSRKFFTYRHRLNFSNLLRSETADAQLRHLTQSLSKQEWQQASTEYDLVCSSGARILSLLSPSYPASLRDSLEDPPICLYLLGNPANLEDGQKTVGIVGMRRASAYGKHIAEQSAERLSRQGAVIISGLAYGIDAAAHRGAIRGSLAQHESLAGVAVLGSGLFNIYPKEHYGLSQSLLEQGGALISEYGLKAPPLKHQFPERNRLISALSKSLLIVEAELRSGSLITARLGLEQGKEIFAAPGRLGDSGAEGPHLLIKQGAQLYSGAEDIAQYLGLNPQNLKSQNSARALPQQASAELIPQETAARLSPLIDKLQQSQIYTFEDLLTLCNLPAPELSALLAEAELHDKIIENEPGQYTLPWAF